MNIWLFAHAPCLIATKVYVLSYLNNIHLRGSAGTL
jgi:hypothetical protein